jgi:DNA polymerase I-like protein with 3'-5' exonuclease and polymerase domains
MQFITIDFETYYSREFSLSKVTTEEYVRSDQFEIIGVGVKVNDEEAEWFSGNLQETKNFLAAFDWAESIAVAHNAPFDAAILTWRLGIRPYMWVDTLAIARAVDGLEQGNSLKKLAERHGLGIKGTEVLDALGKHRKDFLVEDLKQYGEYCKNDTELTFKLLNIYLSQVSEQELQVISITTKMFSEPVLELDVELLEQHLEAVRDRKSKLLEAAEADRETLMSNDKFAELLKSIGVDPPRKISNTTGKETWAFAKTDEGFKALLEHEDETVQTLAAARLGTKSTLEETRTQRFISIAKRGKLPVPLRYYAAHTGRWGGDDKLNLQNLPSRGTNTLKNAIIAPDGYVIIDSDSSQIEARMLAWLAGQVDLVEAFKNGEDVYKIMASAIYNKPIEEITKQERFVGKTTILGAGYGMGAEKFKIQLKNFGVDAPLEECQRIITVYRQTYPKIPELWRQAGRCLDAMIQGAVAPVGVQPQALSMDARGFRLPNDFHIKYFDLRSEVEGYTYKSRNGRTKVYGGKVVENLCQALARCVIAEQMVKINKKYKVVLTVHDAVACVATEDEAEEAKKYVEKCMRWTPEWAEGLPLNCEAGYAHSYGEC